MRPSILLAIALFVFPVALAKASPLDKIALKVIDSQVEAPAAGEQCRGTFTVKNIGPAFRIPPDVCGTSHTVSLYDQQGILLFRNHGGWGPGMSAGGTVSLRWNTRSNHLGETSEPAFLIPAPGRYRLEIVLAIGPKRKPVLDVHSEWFVVKGKKKRNSH